MFHKEGGAFLPPEPLGRVEVAVNELSPNGTVLERTLSLQPASGVKQPKGTLRLLLKYNPIPASVLRAQEEAEAEEEAEAADKVGPMVKPPNQLIVTLRRCENLKPMNKSIFGKAVSEREADVAGPDLQASPMNFSLSLCLVGGQWTSDTVSARDE